MHFQSLKQIRKNLYNIKNSENLSTQKKKEIEESLFNLEERLSDFKKYRSKDDFEHRNIKNLYNRVALKKIAFTQSIDEDCYRPTRTESAFNGIYIEYESKRDKDKNLLPKEYLDTSRPYLSDTTNNHKIPKNLRVHSSNEVIDYETQFGEWKIQLTMSVNFISSKYSDETRNMHIKSGNIEIMMGSEADDIIDEFLNLFCKNIKKDQRNQ